MFGKKHPSVDRRTELARVLVLVTLYVLIGNARSIQPNPFIPGAVIAVYMVIPVVAGILFGCHTGAKVGFFGTLLNALSPAGSVFEFASIIPHTIMGMIAGCFRGKFPTPIVAASILIGHVLNIMIYLVLQLIPLSTIAAKQFWFGLGYEAFIGITTVYILVTIYRLGFQYDES